MRSRSWLGRTTQVWDAVVSDEASGRKLALFGNGVRRMVKGGTGSGDVNARSVTDVEQGLQDAGFEIGTTAWLDRFDQDCADCGKEYMTRFQFQ